MIALDEIKQMPLHEKLMLMEAIWDGIRQNEPELGVLGWHKNILDEREASINKGEAGFIDWETARKQIQDAIS